MSDPVLNIPDMPLRGTRMIEASAGTGKTYTIAALYLRLLLDARHEFDRELDIANILVVTFTEAATEELRGRIRERLREALTAFEQGHSDDELLALLLERNDSRTEAARRLGEMITRMDEAPILTIHGFCNRVLVENAFESGTPFRPEIITDAASVAERLMEDFWRRSFYGQPTEWVRWLRGEWSEPRDLLRDVLPLVRARPRHVLPEAEPDDDAEAALNRARDAFIDSWAREGDDALAWLETAVAEKRLSSNAKNGYAPRRLAEALEALEAWLEAPSPPLPEGFELFTREVVDARTLKAGTPPEHALFDDGQALVEAAGAASRQRRVGVLREAMTWLARELPRELGQAQQLSFDQLLTSLAEALESPGGEALAGHLAGRYPVALIDEFQDTDPAQYSIFRRIHHGRDGCGLFMIGDPKQAIYAFRGADIHTYLAARRSVARDNARFTLDRNWRSTAALVDSVSALFRRSPSPFLFEDIELPEVAAAGRADDAPLRVDGTIRAGLGVHFLPGRDDGKGHSKEHARAELAAATATEIAGLLEHARAGRAWLGERALAAKDLAVLVRTHNEAEVVRRALARLGVPSVMRSRDSVIDSAEAANLLALLHAVAEPTDEIRLRAALCSPLMGRTAGELHRELNDGSAWDHRVETFQGYRERWQRVGVLPMLHGLWHEQGVIERVFRQPDAERRMTNLLHLGELLQEAAAGEHGIAGLLHWFEHRRADDAATSEATELRLESDAELVQILTIHASKGLQFPLVFLPFVSLGKEPKKPEKLLENPQPIVFHAGDDSVTLDLGSGRFLRHHAMAAREAFGEELRLLYVALTRAAHCCRLGWCHTDAMAHTALAYLLAPPPTVPDDAPPVAALPGHDDASLRSLFTGLDTGHGPISVDDLANTADPGLPAADLASARGEAAPIAGRIAQGWRLTSYTGLLTGHAGQHIEAPDHDAGDQPPAPVEPASDSIFALPSGARTGRCLHRILELADFRAPDALEALVRDTLPGYGFEARWQGLVSTHLRGVLTTALDDKGLRLGALAREQRLDEMAFFLPANGVTAERLDALLPPLPGTPPRPALGFAHVAGMVKGYIDLVFEHDGRYYVVDYKSNHLGNRPEEYAPERLARAMAASRYDLQYQLYTLAVHRYLRARLRGYDYRRHFGGVFYLFLRGMSPGAGPEQGVFRDRPDAETVERLDRLFAGSAVEAIP